MTDFFFIEHYLYLNAWQFHDYLYICLNSGTLKERGIEAWQVMIDDKADNMKEFDGDVTIYDIPLPRYLKKSKVFRRLPFIPPVRE